MGVITGASQNKFKTAGFIFSKVKRDLKSFGAANLLDEDEFPKYVADVLRELGMSAYKEEDAILTVKRGKALLPKDFMQLHAAYKCCGSNATRGGRHFQNKNIFENDITCEVLGRKNNCKIHCECPDKIIERVTIKQYVNENECNEQTYNKISLLKLSPNVREKCSDDCLNHISSSADEISITNGAFLTNFDDGDIYLKYYAFPQDDDGMPMIPDIVFVEKAVENYIKWQILLNFWAVSDVPDMLQKVQYFEAAYNKAIATAHYNNKLPAFSTLVNDIRTRRGINKTAIFSQIDRNR